LGLRHIDPMWRNGRLSPRRISLKSESRDRSPGRNTEPLNVGGMARITSVGCPILHRQTIIRVRIDADRIHRLAFTPIGEPGQARRE
jgi:hypothetical protein